MKELKLPAKRFENDVPFTGDTGSYPTNVQITEFVMKLFTVPFIKKYRLDVIPLNQCQNMINLKIEGCLLKNLTHF